MPSSFLRTRFCSTWLHEPPSTSSPSSLFSMQLQNAREAVDVLRSMPSSAICAFWSGAVRGKRPSRMFKYLMVTCFELTTLSTSPLLPLGVLKGGSLRDTSDFRSPGDGPLAPEQPLWVVS